MSAGAVFARDWLHFRSVMGRIGFIRFFAVYCVLLGVFVPTRFDDPRAAAVVFALIPMYLAGPMAVDAIAGERDRKTLEALLHTPVSPPALTLGKLLFPVAVAMALSTAAVASNALYSTAASRPLAGPADLGAALAMGVPLSLLFSALGLHISLGAKSSRSAQQWYSISLLAFTIGLPLALRSLLPALDAGTAAALGRLFEGGVLSGGAALLFAAMLTAALALSFLAYRRFRRLWTMNSGSQP